MNAANMKYFYLFYYKKILINIKVIGYDKLHESN